MSFFITIKIIIVLLLFQATLISRSVSQEINDAADPYPGKSLELTLELSYQEKGGGSECRYRHWSEAN